jgi:hypothetical protein
LPTNPAHSTTSPSQPKDPSEYGLDDGISLDNPDDLARAWRDSGAGPHLWITDSHVPTGCCCVCGQPKDADGHPWDRAQQTGASQ